jgi:hypothetical protein
MLLKKSEEAVGRSWSAGRITLKYTAVAYNARIRS